jgi:2-polyprenyl-3-methyl-5-hydroxy-6-metoxy-1,4-benzoquinol methylase
MKCPVCKKEIVPEKTSEKDKYTLFKCTCCGVIYSDPMENPGPGWYEEDHIYKIEQILESPRTAWHHKCFLARGTKQGKILDIGCGIGHFLSAAQKTGYEPHGMDFNKRSLATAKSRFQLTNLYQLTIDEFFDKYPDIKFDFVTFFEVIEHLQDPSAFLNSVKKILKPGGIIAFSTPNRERLLNSLGEYDEPPHHLTKWNKKAAENLISQSGFHLIKSRVKDLEADDIIGYLKYKSKSGIIKKMVKNNAEKDASVKMKVKILVRLKESAFFCIKIILLFLLLPLRLTPFLKEKGGGMYFEARLG